MQKCLFISLFFEVKECFTLPTVVALKWFLMDTVEPLNIDTQRWQKIGCLGPVAILGNVSNPSFNPTKCISEQLLTLPTKDSISCRLSVLLSSFPETKESVLLLFVFKYATSVNHQAHTVLFTACFCIFVSGILFSIYGHML